MNPPPTFVLDASVAAKWYLPEADSDAASQVLAAAWRGTLRLLAPELLLVEVGHAAWKRQRRGEATAGDPEEIVRALRGSPLAWTPDRDLAESAAHLAAALGCTVYDAMYVALAETLDASLVTSDRRLRELAADFLAPGHALGLADVPTT